jgi:uncharacterized Zn-binding protein involved in type VI secretion
MCSPNPHVGGPIIVPCAPNVLIGELPAARMTDTLICVGAPAPDVIIEGSPTVMIENLMAARMMDPCAHGGMVVMGCPTVMIGDGGSVGGTMTDAKKMGAPFAQSCGG